MLSKKLILLIVGIIFLMSMWGYASFRIAGVLKAHYYRYRDYTRTSNTYYYSYSSVIKPTATPSATIRATARPVITSAPVPNNSSLIKAIVTYYGWPDNDPPGTAIAYPVIHRGAGGTGTYQDPITFASSSQFSKGQILYVPYIKKYVIKEDLCASCTGNWIDIWMNSNSNYSSQVTACERYWTRWQGNETNIEINPPSNREVDTRPLFNINTGVCLK